MRVVIMCGSASLCFYCYTCLLVYGFVFFFQAEDGIRDVAVTGVQTCALPICPTVECEPSARTDALFMDNTNRGRAARRRSPRAPELNLGFTVQIRQAISERNGEIGRASCRERV